MRDRKATKSKVAATMAAIFALFASLVVAATPASASPSAPQGLTVGTATVSPCGDTMPVQPFPGWERDARRIYKDDGTTKIQTVDRRVTTGKKIEMCVWNDFLPGTLYSAYIDNPDEDFRILGTTPGYFSVDCPQDGKQHYWSMSLLPWDRIHYVGGYGSSSYWYAEGYMNCGSPSSSVSTSPVSWPAPGTSPAAATTTCAKRGGLVAKHVQRRLKPKQWVCVQPPRLCLRAQALKQAGKAVPARKARRACGKTLQRWRH